MIKSLTKVIDEKRAKRLLKAWARKRKAASVHYSSCTYFDYSDRPFWAIIVELAGWGSDLNGLYGLHVYEDGEVKLVNRQQDD